MTYIYLLCVGVISMFCMPVVVQADAFSFKEVEAIATVPKLDPQFIVAGDNLKLAYYPYLPKKELHEIIIFYHGGGIYCNNAYQWVGKQLSEDYGLGIYLVDIRGHGHSQGPRGDASSIEQVWEDVDSVVNFVSAKHPQAKIFLAGHSSGAGLILNYASWKPKNKIAGLICISPYLGPQSGAVRDYNPEYESAAKSINYWVFAMGTATGGWLYGHKPAVYFNNPDRLRKQDPLILEFYTFNMACAMTPFAPLKVFKKIQQPLAIYVGSDDEQLVPQAVINFKNDAKKVKHRSMSRIITGAKHLSIVVQIPQLLSEAVGFFGK